MATLVIKNIGKIVSGDIDHPVLEGSVIVINENLIEAIGGEELLANVGDATVVDANGTTVTPGLWDTHVHVSTADGYGTRQKTFGFIESAKNGGVTTMISAGECHIPGHPKGDPVYTKAQAIVGHKCFAKGVSGVKVEGGGLILEKGLVEKDFEDLAKEGVWVVGEIGLGTVNNPETAAPMVEWAHKHGFKVQMHTGGTSILAPPPLPRTTSSRRSPTLFPTSMAARPPFLCTKLTASWTRPRSRWRSCSAATRRPLSTSSTALPKRASSAA